MKALNDLTDVDYFRLSKMGKVEWKKFYSEMSKEDWINQPLQLAMVFVQSTTTPQAKQIANKISAGLNNAIEIEEVINIAVLNTAGPIVKYCSENPDILPKQRFYFASGIRRIVCDRSVIRESYKLVRQKDRMHRSINADCGEYFDWESAISADAQLCSSLHQRPTHHNGLSYCADDTMVTDEIMEDADNRSSLNSMIETIRPNLKPNHYNSLRSLVLDNKTSHEISSSRNCTYRTVNNHRSALREYFTKILCDGGIDANIILAS